MTIQAKGSDLLGHDTDTTSYLVSLPSNYLDLKAYDANNSTEIVISANNKQSLEVANDGLVKAIKVKSNAASGSKVSIYDEKGCLYYEFSR